eukprot:6449670-Amphidinium_carterae.2
MSHNNTPPDSVAGIISQTRSEQSATKSNCLGLTYPHTQIDQPATLLPRSGLGVFHRVSRAVPFAPHDLSLLSRLPLELCSPRMLSSHVALVPWSIVHVSRMRNRHWQS